MTTFEYKFGNPIQVTEIRWLDTENPFAASLTIYLIR
jgi:hypothetical protein